MGESFLQIDKEEIPPIWERVFFGLTRRNRNVRYRKETDQDY